MTRSRRRQLRGLTLLELMLSLMVTALVAGSIAGMMGAVSTGLSSHQDMRAVMIRANAAQSRLSAYITPSRCLLGASATGLTIWLDDSRESNTVHASEVRWLRFDASAGAIVLSYVKFPDAWSQTARDLADGEHAASSDWDALLSMCEGKGLISSLQLVDGLADLAVQIPTAAQSAKHVTFDLDFNTGAGSRLIKVSAAIERQQPPVK
jgi:hypothetical protein